MRSTSLPEGSARAARAAHAASKPAGKVFAPCAYRYSSPRSSGRGPCVAKRSSIPSVSAPGAVGSVGAAARPAGAGAAAAAAGAGARSASETEIETIRTASFVRPRTP